MKRRTHIPSDEVQRLKQALPQVLQTCLGVEDLSRPFRCPSPDHEDRNPSAHYFRQGNVVYCFGCGRKWDSFELVGMLHGIDGFPEQARAVAEIAGGNPGGHAWAASLGPPGPSCRDAPEEEARLDLTRACQDAFDRLFTPAGDAARTWLHDRGVDDEQMVRHGLGLVTAPSRELAPAFTASEPGAVFVSFPYWGPGCTSVGYAVLRTVSLTARTPRHKEWRPKGIRSPLWRGWELSSGHDCVAVCEGPLDAIALEARHPGLAVMALGGTSMAKRLVATVAGTPAGLRPAVVLLALDEDAAGRACADSLEGDLAGLGVRCVRYPGFCGHKDPADWLVAERDVTWHYETSAIAGLGTARHTRIWEE